MSDLVTAAEIDDTTPKFRYPAGSQIEKVYKIGLEIRARVKKLDQYGVKAVDMVDSIEHLLKDAEALCDADGFEAFKKSYCDGLSKSRTYELLAIRDGRKTLEEIREAGRLRVAKHREAKRVTEKDSVTSLPAQVNGQAVDVGELGPAAQEQIAKALEAGACPCPMCNEQHDIKAASPSAPMFDYDPSDDPETQPGDSEEVIRRRGFLFRAAESAAMACADIDNLPIDNEMRAAAKAAADDWNAVVERLGMTRH